MKPTVLRLYVSRVQPEVIHPDALCHTIRNVEVITVQAREEGQLKGQGKSHWSLNNGVDLRNVSSVEAVWVIFQILRRRTWCAHLLLVNTPCFSVLCVAAVTLKGFCLWAAVGVTDRRLDNPSIETAHAWNKSVALHVAADDSAICFCKANGVESDSGVLA